MQGAWGSLLPQGLEGPELQSCWESVFLKSLPTRFQMAAVLDCRGGGRGCVAWLLLVVFQEGGIFLFFLLFIYFFW